MYVSSPTYWILSHCQVLFCLARYLLCLRPIHSSLQKIIVPWTLWLQPNTETKRPSEIQHNGKSSSLSYNQVFLPTLLPLQLWSKRNSSFCSQKAKYQIGPPQTQAAPQWELFVTYNTWDHFPQVKSNSSRNIRVSRSYCNSSLKSKVYLQTAYSCNLNSQTEWNLNACKVLKCCSCRDFAFIYW